MDESPNESPKDPNSSERGILSPTFCYKEKTPGAELKELRCLTPPLVAEALSGHPSSLARFCQKWIRKHSCKPLGQQNWEANQLQQVG